MSCVAWPKWLTDLLGLNCKALDVIVTVLYPVGAIVLLILWQVDRCKLKKLRSRRACLPPFPENGNTRGPENSRQNDR